MFFSISLCVVCLNRLRAELWFNETFKCQNQIILTTLFVREDSATLTPELNVNIM